MEALLWGLRTLDSFSLAMPIVVSLALCFTFFQSDLPMLLIWHFGRSLLGRSGSFVPRAHGERPTGMVIIPSLLRDRDDLNAITTTVESCAQNGYPSELYIVASVDGLTEKPALYKELKAWVAQQRYAETVHVYVSGTQTRLGKMMAVEAGVSFMRELVDAGKVASFPDVYFSIDGDGTLSPNALERLAHRLATPHPLTGNLRRIVSGKISIRYDLVWQGWRAFFTIKGQIFNQVGREFVVSNVARFNWKSSPQIGVPGALYCTWSELICAAPRYMGFMQTITFGQWMRWWVGLGPPKFSESNAPALPEALTGASDDTCIAFLASMATWRNGALCFDAPRTPMHALGRFIISNFFERSHDYEPEARAFTYTPTTINGLWKQRVRWNASRVECAGRFWRAFWFHWEIGLPVSSHMIRLLQTVFNVGFYYLFLPYFCFGSSKAVLGFAIGYAGQTIAYSLYTMMALTLERDRRQCWRVMLCLPTASLYCILINCFGCVVGVTKDIFLFGNTTNFAPEWTLMKGRCERIALAFRTRRLLALMVRSALYGDVPFGSFWFGWHETAWTPSGFEGWTTGKPQRAIVPMPSFGFLRPRRAAPMSVGVPIAAQSPLFAIAAANSNRPAIALEAHVEPARARRAA